MADPIKVEKEPVKNEKDEELQQVETGVAEQAVEDGAPSFPMRETSISMPCGGEMNFNGFTSMFGFLVLWGLAIWCMVLPKAANTELARWKTRCTELFTWLYIGTKPLFQLFILYIGIRFRKLRLGKDTDKPEFSNITYFVMLFSAGIAVGLFFFGVSEPLWHRESHWFANAGYHSQDEIDQFAINQTLYHWGFAGWCQYTVVAICAGLASYRFGLPFTFRSCFYPLLGEYTWGWIGDVIDGFTIITTVAGVCTSLGLGAMQIIAGLQRLGFISSSLSDQALVQAQAVTIWFVTLIATVSVVSGLNVGIKYLSHLGFGLGMLILFLAFIMEKTPYILNVFVQSMGYYFQWSILQINFHTDAFAQLAPGEGRAVDGLSAAVWWMDAWAVFYMAWWTAWAGFVGLFVARISKGRTILEVVLYSFFVPLLYAMMWFCTFGGIGIRQARQAEEMELLGEEYFGNPGELLVEGSEFCYDVPQSDVVVNGTTVFTNTLLGVTPVCKFNPAESDAAWYNVMYSLSFASSSIPSGFGPFMAGLSVVAVIVYFVTSSDSGSLIVDHLASNGSHDHHWVQRVFWALTEGAVATALLLAGGSDSLKALQAGSVVSGLPFTVFVTYQCQAIYIMCRCAEKCADSSSSFQTDMAALRDRHDHGFAMPVYGGIFNIFEYIISLGSVHESRVKRGMHLPTSFQFVEFFKALFLPFWSIYRIYEQHYPKDSSKLYNKCMTALYALFFFAWVILFIMSGYNIGFVYFGWTAFFLDGLIMTNLRMSVRNRLNIKGNVLEDFAASSFLYPQGLTQMLQQFEVTPPQSSEEAEE